MKFETINGTLCLITEPKPLTEKDNLPVAVGLIIDDSRMGKLNEYESRRLGRKTIIAIEINENGVVRADDRYFYEHYTRYEILGYPVADGSAEWALFQMMDGQHVIHEGLTPCNIHCGMVTWLDSQESKQYTMQSPDKWLIFCPFKDGWQLYEPKPLLAEAKVGDLCQRRDGTMITCINGEYSDGIQRYPNGKECTFCPSPADVISTEPLAPEGSAEWAWKYCSTLESQIDASLSSLCNTLACMDKRNAFYIAVKVVADSLSSIREYPAEYGSEQIAKATGDDDDNSDDDDDYEEES